MQKYCSIMQDADEGFADFTFDIIKMKKKLFGGFALECAAEDEGKAVGFGLEIKKNMRGLINRDVRTFCTYSDGMKLTYQAGMSDDFLASVGRLYEFDARALRLKDSAYIECGALSGDPANLQQEEVDFKCFVNVNDESSYAEFYINIDLPNKKLYLKEKDMEYRKNIIRFLSR